jgi:alpha-beta hydrolase superfamily lysophospholipase
MKESTFEGVGGLKIFTRSWQPEGKTRGVVVIVPGFNSHSGIDARVPATQTKAVGATNTVAQV